MRIAIVQSRKEARRNPQVRRCRNLTQITHINEHIWNCGEVVFFHSIADPKTAAEIDALLAAVRGETKRDRPTDISRERALEVFDERYRKTVVRWFEITDTLPGGSDFLRFPTNCWFVEFFLTYDDPSVWPQSRLVAVSKSTGEIVYDDSANDEG